MGGRSWKALLRALTSLVLYGEEAWPHNREYRLEESSQMVLFLPEMKFYNAYDSIISRYQ